MGDTQIKEPVLLAALAKQGIAAANVALWRGYAPRSSGSGYSPYAQTYQDALSGKKFAVISGLPMVDAYGQGHELTWSDKNGIIENGNNIFHAVIDKGTTRIHALSEQSNGAGEGDDVVFHPQLYIDDTEILPLSDMPQLLETDPLNENYPYNTLEWDYGVCLRRIRLIEGRFLGSWVFTSAPIGNVLIKYNQSGKFRLRLQYATDADTEFIPKAFFDANKEWPVIISDSATFYPDANPETSSVDGDVRRFYDDGESWAGIRSGAGTAHDDSSATCYASFFITNGTAWRQVVRSIFLFDTSSLEDSAVISAATLSLYGSSRYRDYAWDCNTSIYPSTPASNNDLVNADYSQCGGDTPTSYSDTDIGYSGWNTSGYNDWPLNAAGLAAISKTGVTKFSTRSVADAENSEPYKPVGSNSMSLMSYTAEQGEGYQPKLVVTYTSGAVEKSAAENGTGDDVKTPGYPIVLTDRGETGGGLESLGSRDLGRPETASGLDAGSLLAAFAGNEAGSGTEAALKAVAVLSGDTGLGAELSGMLKDAVAADEGAGADALKAMKKMADSSTDTRLSGRTGRTGRMSKKAEMPSRRVNL